MMPTKNTAAAASSATTVPSSATTVPSSATTVPSSTTTTASSSWSIIQSPPSTLTPIVDRWPGNPLNLNDRPASYIETIRYLELENSRLKREVQTIREMSNIEAVLSNERKLLDETDTKRVTLEVNIKRLRDDDEDLENKLEKKTKNLQIAERNAMIHEKCSSDLQSWVKCKTLTEKQSDRSKALLDALKHQEKEQVDFANVIISRVLCVSWKSSIKGSIFLPQMAEYMQTQSGLDFSDIIHQALKEVMCMFSRGEDPLIDVSSGREDSPYSQASSLFCLVEDSFCQLPLIPIRGDNSSEPKSFTYLLDCYSRIAIEGRNHGKQSSVLSDTLFDVVTILKTQCVHYSSLVLQGLIGICQAAVIPKYTTYLYYRILSQNLPWGYLDELVARTYMNLNMFDNIFTPVLKQLCIAIHTASFYGNTQRRPIEALGELIEIRCERNSNIHPIYRLITNEVKFLPDVMTSAAGRELSRTSLLGPFLSALVCAEEQPKPLELQYSFIIPIEPTFLLQIIDCLKRP